MKVFEPHADVPSPPFTAETPEGFWEDVDSFLQRCRIYHGIPLGITDAAIVTSSRLLTALLACREDVEGDEHDDGDVDDERMIAEDFPGTTLHASWYTARPWNGRSGVVFVLRDAMTGRFRKAFFPYSRLQQRLAMLVETGGKRCQYTLANAEIAALQRLRQALDATQWHAYVLADGFFERGRSGVSYLLRKNRPTLAFTLEEEGMLRPLCALCLHPLGYYRDTWAGVMAPSDEVLAHLMFIRGDEHYFWRKANQLPLAIAESGV